MPIVCLGDFGQLPPVTKIPGRAATLANSPASSPLFEVFREYSLTQAMRSRGDAEFTAFCDTLADGNACDGAFEAEFPACISVTASEEEALQAYLDGGVDADRVDWSDGYPDPLSLMTNRVYKSAVLAYTNDIVDEYNEYISDYVAHALKIPSAAWHTSTAFHAPAGESGDNFATFDVMNMYTGSGVPAATLSMFPGMYMQLMRDFLPSQGLVNGAYVIPVSFTKNTVTVVNVTRGSAFFGQKDTLFRFLFKCQLKDVMEFNRRQFPLRAAYAGTVHKYQGDTIDENGLLLIHASNCFAHGQLSVAFSRARRAAQVMVVADEESTYRRVVHGMAYREFLELAPRADEDGYDSEGVDDGPGPIDELYDTREDWW